MAIAQAAWFAPVLRQGFIADDFAWLACSERISRGDDSIFSREVSGFFRPVIYLTILANYRLCGLDPAGYNAVNIALEIACSAVLALLVFRLTDHTVLAVLGMLLFATHNAHGEVVGWISARTSSICCLMSLLTLLAWTRWRRVGRRRWWIAAMTCFTLAVLSKEEAAALLPVLVLLDLLVLSGRPVTAAVQGSMNESQTLRLPAIRRASRSWMSLAPAALVLGAYLGAQWFFQSKNWIVQGGAYRPHWSAPGHLVSQLSALFISKRVVQTPYLESLFAGYALMGWLLLRRGEERDRRLAFFGLLAACAALAPTLFFTTHDAARYRYIATCFSALTWCAVAQAALRPGGPPRIAGRALACFLVLVIVVQTVDQRIRLADWNRRGDVGHRLLASTISMADTLREAEAAKRTVYAGGYPRGTDVRSLFWLIAEVVPERVVAISDEGSSPSTPSRPGDLILRWLEVENRWVVGG